MTSLQPLLILFCILESGYLSVVSCQCVLGNKQIESSEYTVPGGYLDIDHPATCYGNLTKWHFCYHSNSLQINEPNAARFRVWRQVSPPSGTEYTLVHDHPVTLIVSTTNDSLICMEEVLGSNEQLEVIPGDIVGAYTPHLNFQGPALHIYGTTANSEGRLLREDRRAFQTINGRNIDIADTGDVENVAGITLHLYAEIGFLPPSSSTQSLIESTRFLLPSTSTQSPMESTQATTASSLLISVQPTDPGPNMASTQQQASPSPTSNVAGNTGGGGDGSGGGGGDVGGIVAGVIVSLVVVAAVAAIIIIGVVMYWKRRGRMHKLTGQAYSTESHTYEAPATLRNAAGIQQKFAADYEAPVESKHTNAVESAVESHKLHTWERSDYYPYPPGEFDSSDDEDYRQEPGSNPSAANVFNIYNSLGPDDSEYCQMMKAAVQSTAPQESDHLEPYNPPPDNEQQIYKELNKLNTMTFPQKCIRLSTKIESSPFGTVNQATMKYGKDRLDVMVKVLSANATEAEKIKFLQEAAIVAQFKHPNVICCYGIVKGERPMLVLEYPHRGRLIDSLIKKRPSPGQPIANVMSTERFLLKTAQQVALGMSYLSSKKFIHRLLSARSVFLSKENICKIGEFGMSRDLADSNYYLAEDNPIPVKWMAPESVNYHKFSTSSDVWSYGCLLYEMWSLGVEPFHDTKDSEVAAKLHSGYRLPPPSGCPRTIYELMINCWNPDPSARPSFRDLLQALLAKQKVVLSIPPKDASTHKHASVLGELLEAGAGMYTDLCWKYQSDRRQTFIPSVDGVPTFDNEEYVTTSEVLSQDENEEIYEDVIDILPQKNSHQEEITEIYEDSAPCNPPNTAICTSNDETSDIYEDLSGYNPSETAESKSIHNQNEDEINDSAEMIYEDIAY